MFARMNGLSQSQLVLIPDMTDSKIFANQILDQIDEFVPYTNIDFNNDIESIISDDLWNKLVSELNSVPFNQNQFTEIMTPFNEILELQNTCQHTLKSTNLNQLQLNPSVAYQNFIQTSTLSLEPKTIDNAILTQSILPAHYQSDKNALMSKTIKVNQNQSKSVTPIVCMSDSNANMPYNTMEMQNDLLKLKKIQIKCQPRSKFRPRTQNESKSSSHYLRCEDGAEVDYPAIYVPQIWACQSDMNIIEVALMDIEKQPHPYVIDNKMSKNSFEDEGLILKQNEPHVLYFRLTNEDFLQGFKTFMIELIKSKQDNVITKKLIRLKKLDQSMLRFTRIYRDDYGKYQRDIDSEEFSCIMTEYYGDVTVEHVGPRYGPMSGEEMVYIVLKGRIVKDNLSVIISEQTTDWSEEINKFMINGTFIYFPMPVFPYPQVNRVNAIVNIYYKKQKIYESTYLYTNLLDQELVNSNSGIDMSMISNNINHIQFDMLTSRCPIPLISQKTSKSKSKKRLNSK